MSSFRSKTQQRAQVSADETRKFGYVGQVIINSGQVPRLFADWQYTDQCYVVDGDGMTESEVRAKVTELVKKHTGKDNPQIYTCVGIEVVKDTALSQNTTLTNNLYVDTTPKSKNRTNYKDHAGFFFDHVSDELDDNIGKKIWVHISWRRLTAQYGGDLTLTGRDETRNEWGYIVTILPNKRAATDLVKSLSSEEVTQNDLVSARGYPVEDVNAALREAAQGNKGKDAKAKDDAPALSAIGPKTVEAFTDLASFTEKGTVGFLNDEYAKLGSIEALAEMSNAETGDLALLVGDKDFFRGLMDATGLGETEAVVKVAEDTGVVNAADIAILLDLDEAPF